MKKVLFALAAVAALSLSSCGGKSDANREQISNAHEEAHQMLRDAKAAPAAPAPVQQPTVEAPADSVK